MTSTHLVIYAWYPLSKIREVQTRYAQIAEEKGTTTAIKSTRTYSSTTEKGFTSVTYHEIEEGNLEEALNYLAEYMSGFWTIEGYSYRIDFAASPKQAQEFSSRFSKYAFQE